MQAEEYTDRPARLLSARVERISGAAEYILSSLNNSTGKRHWSNAANHPFNKNLQHYDYGQ